MAKIKIKIDDLFDRLGIKEKYTNSNEESFTINETIKVKNNNEDFVNINEYVIKKVDSYKTIFTNEIYLISSNEHIIMTSNGCKKIKDIEKDDDVLLKTGKKVKLLSSTLYRKNDILYDFCLDYPHLFISTNGLIHHNSLVITYIIKTLFENYKKTGVKNAIIIVPNIQLIRQFHNDIIDYGLEKYSIGEVYTKKKEWDKDIVISTWQSLSKNLDRATMFDSIIVDEVHGAKAHQLKKILAKTPDAKYRLGFTGTMPAGNLDEWNVKSYLGPVIREYPSGLLADQGYISKCLIKLLNIEYNNDEWEGTYDEVKEEVFNNEYRMDLLKTIIQKLPHNVLLLVGKVEKEGEVLENYLNEWVSDKDIGFISGKDSVEIREEWRKKCSEQKHTVLIATYGIFQAGVNIPNLKYIILVSPFKSKIRVLQSIGRALRKHVDKEGGAVIFDLHDNVKYFHKHGNLRLRHYDAEKFEVDEYLFHEGDSIEENKLFTSF